MSLALYGQSVEFLVLNLAVHKITTRCHVQQFYILPTECISVIFMDLRTNSYYYYVTDCCDEIVCVYYAVRTECLKKFSLIHFLKHSNTT